MRMRTRKHLMTQKMAVLDIFQDWVWISETSGIRALKQS